jgi:hypothetical protein
VKQLRENSGHKTPAAHLEDQPIRLVAELRHGLLQELRGRLKLVEVLPSNLEDRKERSQNGVKDGLLLTGGGGETWRVRIKGSQNTKWLQRNVCMKHYSTVCRPAKHR